MSVRSGDSSDQGAPAPRGAAVDAYADFRPYGERVDLWLRSHWGAASSRPARAIAVEQGHVVYEEETLAEQGQLTDPVLSLDEREARAIYDALDRIFGERQPETHYADAEFLRSVYEREARRVDHLLFPAREESGPQHAREKISEDRG